MTDAQSFRLWLVLVLVGLTLGLVVGLSIRLDDVETQLEHIDSHFRAPEPTETSEGVAG
jgi:hypothetical protein